MAFYLKFDLKMQFPGAWQIPDILEDHAGRTLINHLQSPDRLPPSATIVVIWIL
ncbi:hypothetical protein BU25DRAFT_407519 [Macroventuria anomochaeta]|uniref:Uncharacterized protein n=1 Tax=Macroventuria anomochaeta TaxID=301207 RepID=A0ACB6S9K4_9PLEO|nr:uncharacterized protein BU25DRAFT_407519 [Macroventuria anomochaeta]KAF2630950.1 hypothetical protein BU25DRAFT_407519 [Macroventuria anomochaeta]